MNTETLAVWNTKAPTLKDSLRELLALGVWCSQDELTRVTSHRFGAVLFRLHRDADPVHYETRSYEGSTRVIYRQTDRENCDICSNPKHVRPSERIAQLEALVTELLEDHQRTEPHHEDMCPLCLRASAAISGAKP